MNIVFTDRADEKYFPALALALLDEPRASLQELARAVGISKATLYRFCHTREELINRLFSHCSQVFSDTISDADLNHGPVKDALARLTANYLQHKELTAFLTYYWKDAVKDPAIAAGWYAAMDSFFLRGQREDMFRVDIPAPALTEMWFSIMSGMTDAERRGRIARASLPALIESAFLHGVAS